MPVFVVICILDSGHLTWVLRDTSSIKLCIYMEYYRTFWHIYTLHNVHIRHIYQAFRPFEIINVAQGVLGEKKESTVLLLLFAFIIHILEA